MPRFNTLDRHSLYPIEIWGDTLVVSPRGDAAGFNPKTVHHEMATVTELAQSPGVQHLIIDFAGANYFGSIVLGGLVQLTQTVKNRGGRAAICNASGDMQDILRIMKLDGLWEHFPDRRVALRRVAKIPLPQQLWALRKVAAVTAAIALLIAAYVFYPRPNYGRIYYEQVNALWREYQDREKLAGEEEWRRFSESSTRKMKPMIDHISRRTNAGTMKQSELFVLYVMRDQWPAMLKRNGEESQMSAKWTQKLLRMAEADLEGRLTAADLARGFQSLHTPDTKADPVDAAPPKANP
ncbi:MAG TPA: STAS domain-containing protein [Planctomycetaceae bacterium]|nr:STAS domain-containing protein [Planctomycetaceae bacterium]